MFNGIQIKAFGRLVINKCHVIHPDEIHSVPSSMAGDIIMVKRSDIGISLRQWDNMPRKEFISVALGIQIPFNNDEIRAKAMCNSAQTNTKAPPPQRSRSHNSRHNVHFSSGIL